MPDDIVKRLREISPAYNVRIEAADCIERLSAELAAANARIMELERIEEATRAEANERNILRAELAAERERADRLAAENNELKIDLAKWVNYWRDKDNREHPDPQ